MHSTFTPLRGGEARTRLIAQLEYIAELLAAHVHGEPLRRGVAELRLLIEQFEQSARRETQEEQVDEGEWVQVEVATVCFRMWMADFENVCARLTRLARQNKEVAAKVGHEFAAELNEQIVAWGGSIGDR